MNVSLVARHILVIIAFQCCMLKAGNSGHENKARVGRVAVVSQGVLETSQNSVIAS